jgi:ATP-binding cassette subfamily F protein uup
MFIFEENGKLRQSEGGYTDYQNRLLIEKQPVEKKETGTQGTAGKAKWNAGRERKLKFTYQEQRDYESIEGEIAALEEKIEKLDADMLIYARDFVKLKELTQEQQLAKDALEEKMERWMYLEELAEQIQNQ